MFKLKTLAEVFGSSPEEYILQKVNQHFGTFYTPGQVHLEVANDDGEASTILRLTPGEVPSSIPRLTNMRYHRASLTKALSHGTVALRDLPTYQTTHDLVDAVNEVLETGFRPADFIDEPLEKTQTPYTLSLKLSPDHLLFVGQIPVMMKDPQLADIVPAGLDLDVAILVYLQGTDVQLTCLSETRDFGGRQLLFENDISVTVQADGQVTVVYGDSPAVVVFRPSFTPSVDHGAAWGFVQESGAVNYLHLLSSPESTSPTVVMSNTQAELPAWNEVGVYVSEAFDPVRGDSGFVPGLEFTFRLLVAKPQVI